MQRVKRLATVSLALAVVAFAAACGGSSSSTTTVTSSPAGSSGKVTALNGAGSTLVAPLMSQWQPDYSTSAGVTVTYGAIGSGGGIDAVTSRSVDFGASDAPLTSDQATACKGCIQVPWALAATVVSYHVSGLPDNLKLTGPVVAKIFMGQITSWNDPAIKSLNPGVNLPSTHITPVYRTDGSGDSWVFTSYLSAVSPDWKSKVGASTQPSFPAGTGAEKNSGVAAAIQSTDGAIGYVAVSYIAADSLDEALLQNAAGNYPKPDLNGILAAAKVGTPLADGSVPLVNPPASASTAYPMSTYTYAIVPKDSAKGAALKAFLTYAVTKGQSFGPDLGYPALPATVVTFAKQQIGKIS